MPEQEEERTSISGYARLIQSVKKPLGLVALVVIVLQTVAVALSARLGERVGIWLFVGVCVVLLAALAAALMLAKGDSPGQGSRADAVAKYCSKVEDQWWELIVPDELGSLSYVEVTHDEDANTVMLSGTAYTTEGKRVAEWRSIASCLDMDTRTVWYRWTGSAFGAGSEPERQGFGEIEFPRSDDRPSHARGYFWDAKGNDQTTAIRKSIVWRRCSKEEKAAMRSTDKNDVVAAIKKAIADMS